jgi:hypothetical protein
MIAVAMAYKSGVSPSEVNVCTRIGGRSGCTGCNHGSSGLCEWCVDVRDNSGQNVGAGIGQPRCYPTGYCSLLSNGKLSSQSANVTCPVDPATEFPFRGHRTRASSTTIFSQASDTFYCDFPHEPYFVDRTALAFNGHQCSSVNYNISSTYGVRLSIAHFADRCFNRQEAPLTELQQQCIRDFASIACTISCPAYNVAALGFTDQSCSLLQSSCGPWMLDAPANCPLSSLTLLLGNQCHEDTLPRLEDLFRLKSTDRWVFDYGLDGDYNLPIHCVWSPWSDWSTCSLDCGSGTQTRSRSIWQDAFYEGDACGDIFNGQQSCNTQPCPEDCVYFWNPWSDCSVPCAGGTQTRTINITTPAQNNGAPCPTTSPESKTCNTGSCSPTNFFGTKILSAGDISTLSSWVSGSFTMCYQKTTSSGGITDLNANCLFQGNTPTYVVFKDSDGYVFGMYSAQGWTNVGWACRSDPFMFLFTLVNPTHNAPEQAFTYPNQISDNVCDYYGGGVATAYDPYFQFYYGENTGAGQMQITGGPNFDLTAIDPTWNGGELLPVFAGPSNQNNWPMAQLSEVELFYLSGQ